MPKARNAKRIHSGRISGEKVINYHIEHLPVKTGGYSHPKALRNSLLHERRI